MFSGVRFPGDKARKVLKNFGENLEQNSVRNLGVLLKIRGTYVLQLF